MPLTISIGAVAAADCAGTMPALVFMRRKSGERPRESSRGRHIDGELRAVFLAAVARRELLLFGVLLRRRLDHRAEDLHVGLVAAVRHDVPLLAVPGLDHRGVRALVVLARRLDRLHEAGHAELLDHVGRDRQVLEAPADLLAGERLLAELLLRLA